MMDGETIAFLRSEIKKQVNVILAGMTGTNTQFVEDILSQYPGSPTIQQRPVMHPYGFVSRAPTNTIQVVARVGDHPGARMVLGHRDALRPTINQGECLLYNQYGQAIYLQNGQINIGTMKAADPIPLGNELVSFLTNFLEAYIAHTHVGNLGAPTPLSSGDVETAENLIDNNLSNDAIVSDYIFVDSKAGPPV